jgi:hypothetical protein
MILPQGEIVHENLRTAFVDLNSFLQTLKEDNFSGYIQVSFWDYEGVLFLETGEIVNAIEETQGTQRGGEEAVENIILMSKQKDGRINAYRLDPEMVTILAGTSMKEATYKDLSTEFTSLNKLIEKLGKEKHSGHIDIMLNDKKGRGMIFFQEGEIVEAVMTDEKSGNIYGKDILNNIIDDVQKIGATFNVYRAVLDGGSERAGITQATELQGVIEVMQEVMGAIESLVDGLGKRTGSFRENFTKAQMEQSEDYPFLDPFAAEFEYKKGKIKFSGKVSSAVVLAQGISDCIDITLNNISLEISKDELYKQIRSTLQSTIENLGEKVDNLGLKSIMPNFLGS